MFYLLSYAYFAIFHISSTTELINHVDPKAARNATWVAQHHIPVATRSTRRPCDLVDLVFSLVMLVAGTGLRAPSEAH